MTRPAAATEECFAPDDRARIVPLLYDEERVIVTEDWDDFTELFLPQGIHPGIVAMPSMSAARERSMMNAAITFIETESRTAGESPADYMLNREVLVSVDNVCATSSTLTEGDR